LSRAAPILGRPPGIASLVTGGRFGWVRVAPSADGLGALLPSTLLHTSVVKTLFRLLPGLIAVALAGCANPDEAMVRDLRHELGANEPPPPPALSPTGASSAVAHGSPGNGFVQLKVSLDRPNFAWGDAIEITELWATSRQMKVGDEVVVRGRYRLQSRESARLALSLTASESGVWLRRSSTQSEMVERGTGEFDLSCEIQAAGRLHVSFYPDGFGSSFGGVYFNGR
jgi:hypothetical protein